MDCKVYRCENNNGYGYCECINYITLDENGCCESMFVREEEDKEKDDAKMDGEKVTE